MARIRSYKPEFWTDPGLFGVSRDARLCYLATWTFADDHGLFADEPERLRFQAFAGDRDADVSGWLRELREAGMLEALVDEDGTPLLRIRAFRKHQRIDKPSKSRFKPAGEREPEPEPASPREESGGVTANLPSKRPGRRSAKRKPDPEALPKGFPAELEPFVDPVLAVLLEVAESNAAKLPTRAGVARALADFPRRDFLPVARNYRAWQLDSARRKQKDIVRGYRSQLDMADDVARREKPGKGTGRGIDKLVGDTRRRMAEED